MADEQTDSSSIDWYDLEGAAHDGSFMDTVEEQNASDEYTLNTIQTFHSLESFPEVLLPDDSATESEALHEECAAANSTDRLVYNVSKPMQDETYDVGMCYICREANEFRFPCDQTHGLCFVHAAHLINTNQFPTHCPCCRRPVRELHKRTPKLPSNLDYRAFIRRVDFQ
jgi:hypothetical protein